MAQVTRGSNPFSSANENAKTLGAVPLAARRGRCSRAAVSERFHEPVWGLTTPSGNGLKHVVYTCARASSLVRRPWVDLHPNDEMTNSRRAVVTLRLFSAGEARTPNAASFLGRSSSESQLVTAPCHSLSQLWRAPAIRAIRVRRAAPDLADEAEIGKPLEVPLHGSPRDIGQQLFGLRQRQRASLEQRSNEDALTLVEAKRAATCCLTSGRGSRSPLGVASRGMPAAQL